MTAASVAFPRAARLLQPAQFGNAFKGRRLARGVLFMLHASPPNEAGRARLGMVIGKRFAPLSVSRAAIKRVIREAFRHRQGDLPPYDYVVRLHARIADVSLTELKRQTRVEIDAHFARVIRQHAPGASPVKRSSQ